MRYNTCSKIITYQFNILYNTQKHWSKQLFHIDELRKSCHFESFTICGFIYLYNSLFYRRCDKW